MLPSKNVKGSFSYIGVSPTVMCEGNSGVLTFKVSSFYAGYSYYITGHGIVPTTAISVGGGTQQSINIPLSSYVSAGSYQYKIELFSPNSVTALKTVNITFSYLQAPVFISPIKDVHACIGSPVTVVPTSLGTVTSYQWERSLKNSNDWEILSTTSVLTIPEVNTSVENYSFRCKIKNKGCTESTSNNFVIKTGAPTISQQPQDIESCEKSPIELTIGVSGENISYQWERLMGNIWEAIEESAQFQGTTTSKLKTIATIDLNHTPFRCNIVSSCGNILSETCIVKVIPNPVNPVALFIPECTGSGATTQRRLKITNPQIELGYNILTPNYAVVHSYTHESGDEAILNLTNLPSSENRVIIYSFLSSGLGCASENVEVSLSGSGNVLIGEEPQNLTVCENESAVFQVGDITGIPLAGGIQYQWEMKSTGSFTPINDIASQISGTNTPSLIFHTGFLSAESSYNNTKIRCKVTGQCGSIYSDEAALKVRNPINLGYTIGAVGYQLHGTTYTLNGTLNSALPDVNYYFLSQDGNLKADYINPSSTVVSNVPIPIPNIEANANSLKIKANYLSTPSCFQEANIPLINKALPLITKQPEDVVSTEGSIVAFECSTNSSGATYSWEQSTDNQQSFIPLGQFGATLTLSNIALSHNGYFYRCVINSEDPAKKQLTRASLLTIHAANVTYQKPLSKTFCETNSTLTATVGDAVVGYSYQWQIFESNTWKNLSNDNLYSGVTSTNLVILTPVDNRTYQVRCKITTPSTIATTESADLKKVLLPTQIVKSSELLLCSPIPGKAASLSLSVLSKAYQTYAWNTGETTSNILVRENGVYSVAVSLDGCTNTLEIDIADFQQENLNLDIQGVTTLDCSDANLDKQLFSLSEGFNSYQWHASSTPEISDANNYSIFITEPTTISATIKDSKGCTVSRVHQVTPSVNVQPNVEYVRRCIGTPTLIQGSARSEVKQWLWYNNMGNMISQGRSFAYISQPGTYMLRVVYADGCVGTKRFTVDFEISTTTIANKNEEKEIFFCEQTPVTLSTTALHSTYSWVGPNGFLGSEPTLSVSEEGKYYVTTTNNSASCPGIDTVYVHKYPAPPVEITESTQKICTSTPGIFKPNKRLNAPSGYVSYLWSTGETTLSIEADRIGNHEYTLTVVDNNGCSNVVTHPVNIDYIGIYNKENATCANGDLALEGTEGLFDYEWQWTLNGVPQTLEYPNSRVQLFNITAASTLTLKVTERSNPACLITDVANVQLGEAPKVTITSNSTNTICRGGTLTLVSNVVGEVHNTQWIYNDEVIGTSPSFTVNKPGDYKIIVENTTSGCKGAEIQKIVLQELPKIAILPYQRVCLGHKTNLTVTVPGEEMADYTCVWQDTSNNPVYLVEQPGTYTAKVKHNITGCESQQSIDVDFLNIPPPTVVGHKSFAVTTLFNVSTLENYSSYLWCTGNAEKDIVLSQNMNCNVTVVDSKGCIGTADFSTRHSITTQNITASSSNECYGTNIELSLEDGFKSYHWYVNGELLSFATQSKLTLKEVGEYQIYAMIEDYYNNSITTPSISVTIKPSPDISLQGARTFCDIMPAQFLLKSSITTLAAYEWLKDGEPLMADLNAPYQVSLINSTAVEGLYTLKGTAINGCTTEVSDSIVLRKSKAVVIAPTVACTGDTVSLKASPGYEQYTWQEGGIDVGTEVSYRAFRTGRYSATIQDKYGCRFQTPGHSILFSQNVKFEIIGPNIVCDEDSAELKVSEMFTQYQWSTGETTPSIYVKEHGTYSVTAFNSSTCSSTKEITVYKRPKYNIIARDTACLGTPYRFGTLSITEPGIYQHTFLSREGCDSTVTLSLVFTDPPNPVSIALNETGILYLVDFNQKGYIEWFSENQLMLRANDVKYEPLRNGRFHARFVKHGSCAVNSNEISVNIYSALDVSVHKELVEKDRKAPYYFNDVVPYKITVVNETANVTGNNIVLRLTDFFDKNIFSLPVHYEENKNWKVEGNNDSYTRILQTITIPEFKPKDSVHLYIQLKAESGGTLLNQVEVTLLEDNGRFAKEYQDYLYNNKADADCKVRFSISQLPISYVLTTNGSPENRCVVIRPENQFTTEFYKMEIYLYNRAGAQVYSHQNFENKELCSDDFPAGTFIFVMKFTELETKREYSLTGTITNIK